MREKILHSLRGLFHRVRRWLQGWNAEDAPIERKRRRKTRFYFPDEGITPGRRLLMLGCIVLLAAVFMISAGKLIGYGAQYVSAKRASAALRKVYYEDPTAAPRQEETSAVHTTDAPPEITMVPPLAQYTAAPTATPVPRLDKVYYPNNPYGLVDSRFQKLRRQNGDIIGWLRIEGIIDEAVVQRNNSYYLDRDYLGYHNKNGAIFLDENCSLRTRPYTLLLYGHNMKTGLMFGGLRNYENPTYYHNDPFVSFDSIYEDGRYVIFSVATISTNAADWRYVNLSWLLSTNIPLRTQAIASLNRFSIYQEAVDVRPEDQLLLLITCVDEETDRRIVAARRIREDESESALHQQIRKVRKK